MAFNLLSSWLTVASTLVLGLSHGGPVTVVYGLFIILVAYGAVALSLSEMAARYPTAGGQYHWTAVIAPKSMSRVMVCTRHPFAILLTCIGGICLWVNKYDWSRRHDCQHRYCRTTAILGSGCIQRYVVHYSNMACLYHVSSSQSYYIGI